MARRRPPVKVRIRRPPDGYITLRKAAQLLGVEQDSVYRRLKRRFPEAIHYTPVTTRVITGVQKSIIDELVAEDKGSPK